jgi:hypothetical protein
MVSSVVTLGEKVDWVVFNSFGHENKLGYTEVNGPDIERKYGENDMFICTVHDKI